MTSAEAGEGHGRHLGTIGDVLSRAVTKSPSQASGRFEMRERQTKNFTNPKTKVTSKLEPTAIPFPRPAAV